MVTKTQSSKAAVVAVQAADAATVDAAVTAGKPTAAERLMQVQHLLNLVTIKDLAPDDVKWGKAIALQGRASVYINRQNADVRASQKQVAEWVKAGLGQARGPHSQYLRVTF